MEYKQLSGREFPRFSGIKTFFRLPHVDVSADYDVALVGVPYDGAVSYRPGARFGPSKVRELSSVGRGFHWNRGVNFLEKIKVADIGDCPVVPVDQAKSYQRIEDFFAKLLSMNKKFVAVGGDHSTTLPIIRQLHKKYGKVKLIHFDAHLDTYPAAWDCEYHHGTFVRHAVNEGLIDPPGSIQVGIRGPLAKGDDLDFVKEHKLQVCTVTDIRKKGLFEFIRTLPEFGNAPVYISFDIDCLDPSCAPGTGTPVPGGLTSFEVQEILTALRADNLVGADIVEVSPPFDHAELTSLAAVSVMFEMLAIYAS